LGLNFHLNMRFPALSSLLCLAGLAAVPATAYDGDDPNIRSIPVSSTCLLTLLRNRGTNIDIV
jgi:hypothetical protein